MLKWYLRIYIFIDYLKFVWKSNCIWIIRNDLKKKSEDRFLGSGRVQRCGLSQLEMKSLVGSGGSLD